MLVVCRVQRFCPCYLLSGLHAASQRGEAAVCSGQGMPVGFFYTVEDAPPMCGVLGRLKTKIPRPCAVFPFSMCVLPFGSFIQILAKDVEPYPPWPQSVSYSSLYLEMHGSSLFPSSSPSLGTGAGTGSEREGEEKDGSYNAYLLSLYPSLSGQFSRPLPPCLVASSVIRRVTALSMCRGA